MDISPCYSLMIRSRRPIESPIRLRPPEPAGDGLGLPAGGFPELRLDAELRTITGPLYGAHLS